MWKPYLADDRSVCATRRRLITGAAALAAYAALPKNAEAQLLLRGVGSPAAAASFVPTDIGSALKVWFDPTDNANMTDVSGACSSITNKGSLGGAATNGTAANRPSITSTGGPPSSAQHLDFDGSNDTLVTGNLTLSATTISIYAVVKRGSTSAQHSICGMAGAAGSGILFFYSKAGQDWTDEDIVGCGDGFVSGRAPRAITTDAAASDTTNWHVIRIDLGTSVAIYVDNVATSLSASATGAFTTITNQPFSLATYDGAGSPGAIKMMDLIVGADLTAGDHTNLYSYLKTKAGL